MNLPPGSARSAPPDLGANQEGSRRDQFLSVSVLTRQARHIVEAHRLPITGCQLRRLVRRFVEEDRTAPDLRTYLLGYADPTGETAVQNVMNGRRS